MTKKQVLCREILYLCKCLLSEDMGSTAVFSFYKLIFWFSYRIKQNKLDTYVGNFINNDPGHPKYFKSLCKISTSVQMILYLIFLIKITSIYLSPNEAILEYSAES